MKAKVYVMLKKGILDPQGKAVQQALQSLGYTGLNGVRVGKYLEINMQNRSKTVAEREVREMCERLLANTVIEEYRFEID
jgi:phosphoribosylformylglycinamidine synthase subunit PurS